MLDVAVNTTVSQPDLPQPGNARQLLVIGQRAFATQPLPESGCLRIGRSESADIPLEDPLVSRMHAVLHIGAKLCIEDLGSANGTRVGERSISAGERVELSTGEVIWLGATILTVQYCKGSLGPRRLYRKSPAHALAQPAINELSAPLVVKDPAMEKLYQLVERIALGEIYVLILGETGVGKEVVAEMVHRLSPRAANAFLALNCAALSESLLESELFGFERGAFTGAVQGKAGLLETAQGGTVFLDEVAELPHSIQAKLLRVIERRQTLRLGSLKPSSLDVRFIAATNRDLETLVARGSFRQDLYFRLNGITLRVPPLRDRRSEIEPMAKAFLANSVGPSDKERALSADAMHLLTHYRWPGNVRELRNVIERAVLLSPEGVICAEHLAQDRMISSQPPESPPSEAAVRLEPSGGMSSIGCAHCRAEEAERQHLLDALARCGGNQTNAAKALGISRRTLLKRLELYGLPRPRKAVGPHG